MSFRPFVFLRFDSSTFCLSTFCRTTPGTVWELREQLEYRYGRTEPCKNLRIITHPFKCVENENWEERITPTDWESTGTEYRTGSENVTRPTADHLFHRHVQDLVFQDPDSYKLWNTSVADSDPHYGRTSRSGSVWRMRIRIEKIKNALEMQAKKKLRKKD